MIEEIIKKRKSIRQFNDEELDISQILDTINIAKFAPSGKNRQPWKVKLLEGNDKETLLEILKANPDEKTAAGSFSISINAIEQSSITLLIFNPFSYKEENYSQNRLLMDTQSIGAFIQNILLLCTERDISTLWINDVYYEKSAIESFYVKGEMELIAAIAMGYSNQERRFNIRHEIGDIIL